MAGPMTQAKWSYFVQRDLSEYFVQRYGEFESMLGAFFAFKTPNQAIVYEALVGDLAALQEFNGEISYDDIRQSYRKSVEEIEYAGGVKVTKKLRRNDLYGIVTDRVAALADRVRALREGIGAGIFNGMFDTTLVADGLALCHTAHTSDVGGSNQGNKGSTAFSPAAVEATRRLFIKFKTNTDNIMQYFPDLLVFGTNLEEQGFELIKTNGKVDTAQNNENFHKGKYKMAVWHNWFTSTTDWAFCCSKLMKDMLSFYEWNPTEFFHAGEMDTLTSKHAVYTSVNTSAKDWRWIYAHDVA